MVHDSAHFAKSSLELLVLSILCRYEWQHKKSVFLAHLSRRLIGELIVYPLSGVRRRTSSVVVHNGQTSFSQKPLGRSKPNFMWSLLVKGERNFVSGIWVT